jgi:hypothetical protein
MARHLLEQGDNIVIPGSTLPGTGSLAISFDDTGTNGLTLDFLVLKGTTPVSIDSSGAVGGANFFHQLEETNNNPTQVTISGSEPFVLGDGALQSNPGDGVVTDIAATATSPKTIHSSLTLIDASATTGGVDIFAGATNTSGAGDFQNGGGLNANVTITYTGLVIKGGSGRDSIQNDAKNGVVIDGNHSDDVVTLGGAGAKAILGKGAFDAAFVGQSRIGTNEAPGSALGETVKFGAADTALLGVLTGAEAGSTAATTHIGLTKVLNAAAGMQIDFSLTTGFNTIVDETGAVASSTTLNAAENAAMAAMGGQGIAYFAYKGDEYFIATNNAETEVSSTDAIVKLVGVTNIHHATATFSVVTLA